MVATSRKTPSSPSTRSRPLNSCLSVHRHPAKPKSPKRERQGDEIVQKPCGRKRDCLAQFTGQQVAPPEPISVVVVSGDAPNKPSSLPRRGGLDQLVSALENSHGSSWRRLRFLGKGSFGCVFQALMKSSIGGVEQYIHVAVKSARWRYSYTLQREKRILSDLGQSCYIVGCYGDEITRSSDGKKEYYNLLLEYCSGSTLAGRLKSVSRMPELEVESYTRDVLMGLQHLHAKRFVHCDIKPANILLVPCQKRRCGFRAKIADFGMTKGLDYEDDGMGAVRGTYRYMSPELVRCGLLEFQVDIWALGCTVLEMLTGQCPWGRVDRDELVSLIGYSNQVPYIPDSVSSLARDFLEKCLARAPWRRWDAAMLLTHPFVTFNYNC